MNKILPQKIKESIKCSNPRCVTSTEKYVPNIFYLVNEEKGEYKCMYCDAIHRIKGE